MTFAWTGYVALADELCKRADEAAHRCGISRAYYGVYCQARDSALLSSRLVSDPHIKVHNHYSQADSPRMNTVGTFLSEMYRLRRLADYETGWNRASQNAERAVKKAQMVEKILSEIPPDELRLGRMKRV